ncbi:metallophosphoesterase [Nocardioides bruguierae]|uniref:Metallophosphoesterase n=1 Tax=Nocardioides bruguierae TaxID=2945102 RepID=A0A9X2DBJ4_9ACTN|nr:metallophosphoesterase [Nocardioides bruguierae]MCM0622352.1 metallophosphoesterase [Nocardioides bruguierae]
MPDTPETEPQVTPEPAEPDPTQHPTTHAAHHAPGPHSRRRRTAFIGVLAAIWLAVAAPASVLIFLGSEREVSLASHDTVLTPTLSGYVLLRTGPVLPDLRLATGTPLGIDLQLGKTEASSTSELVKRYAYLASAPDGVEAKIRGELVDLAQESLLRGAVVGLLPVVVVLVLGRRRRGELRRAIPTRQGAVAGVVTVALVLGWWQPWWPDDGRVTDDRSWESVQDFLGDEVTLPSAVAAELDGVEIRGDVTTNQTQRLIESAIDTYDKSKAFYDAAAEDAADLPVRTPLEGEQVVLLVSDRHDNVGMDAVARAVGDAGGATAVMDAGDDTSTGSTWEAFSLDSLQAAFSDLPRFSVSGNHDNGTFVSTYLADLGWTVLDGQIIEGPAGSTLLGTADPRASGLGNWRDESGLSFSEVADRIADAACDSEERVTTLLVHDANMGDPALERGCVDLVLGGHTHVEEGPTAVLGENGELGYSFTTGTTGGAAYAIALGSKPRREAQMTLLTYRDGVPVGIQGVVLQTDGSWDVEDYVRLSGLDADVDTATEEAEAAAEAEGEDPNEGVATDTVPTSSGAATATPDSNDGPTESPSATR